MPDSLDGLTKALDAIDTNPEQEAERRPNMVSSFDWVQGPTPSQQVLLACRDLKSWAIRTMPDWTPLRGSVDLVFRATFARSSSTLGAILWLTEHGYGVQARMLCRPLFEDMVIASYLATAPDVEELTKRYQRHFEVSRRLVAQARANDPKLDPTTTPEDPQEEQELRDLFGVNLERTWTGKSQVALIRLIENEWKGDTDRSGRVAQMWDVYRRQLRRSNDFLHHSPWGLEPYAEVPEEGAIALVIGKTDAESFAALLSAFTIYGLLVHVVIERACPDREADLDTTREGLLARVDAAVEAWHALRAPSPEGTTEGTEPDPSQPRDN